MAFVIYHQDCKLHIKLYTSKIQYNFYELSYFFVHPIFHFYFSYRVAELLTYLAKQFGWCKIILITIALQSIMKSINHLCKIQLLRFFDSLWLGSTMGLRPVCNNTPKACHLLLELKTKEGFHLSRSKNIPVPNQMSKWL